MIAVDQVIFTVRRPTLQQAQECAENLNTLVMALLVDGACREGCFCDHRRAGYL